MAVTEYYKDIDLSFNKTTTGDIPSVINMNSVKVSLYNTLFIGNNENFFEDDFGYALRDILFEHADDITLLTLTNVIENAAENDPRIREVEDININFNEATKEYIITIRVKIMNLLEPQDVELILKKTR